MSRLRSLGAALCLVAGSLAIPLAGSADSAAAAASGASSATSASSATRPLRIMALGDSNTYGFGGGDCDYAGYRGPLQRMLRADGRSVDFVGSVRSGFGLGLDTDHEGWVGARIDFLDYWAAWWLTNARPDVILLHIGTNDVAQAYDLPHAGDRLVHLIHTIRAAAPSTTIIVAPVITSPDPTIRGRITQYDHDLVHAVTAEHAKDHDVFLAAGMETALTPQYFVDFVDLLHATCPGYTKMAAVWKQALDQDVFANRNAS